MPSDYKRYPHNWLTVIRPSILRRAGALPEKGIEAKCESCAVPNHSTRRRCIGDGIAYTTIVLTIAHLDQDVTNNHPGNLAALCQRCHLRHDRPWHLITASLTRQRNRNQLMLDTIEPNEWRHMAKEKQLTHSFNVLLSPQDFDMVKQMADETSTNMSIVIRQAIKSRYLHDVKHIPTCANGRSCFVPHMHATAPATPQGAAP